MSTIRRYLFWPKASWPGATPSEAWWGGQRREDEDGSDFGPRSATIAPSAVPIRAAAFYVYSPGPPAVCIPRRFLRSWSGIMQADAYAGFNRLYEPARHPGDHHRGGDAGRTGGRKFYEIAALKKAPSAVEAVTRIDGHLRDRTHHQRLDVI